MWPPDSDKERIESTIWRKIIGSKIICSDCKNHDPRTFDFSVVEWSEMSIFIRCKKCQHKGEYHPTGDEIRSYKRNFRYETVGGGRGAETNWALEA